MNKVQDEISNLLSYLYIKHPFYNSIISNFEVYIDNSKDSKEYKIYTKGLSVILDIEFANECLEINKKYLFYYIIHEVLHTILFHKRRSVGKKEDFWNYACDITVDNIISKDPVLKNLTITPNSLENKNVIYDISTNVSITTEEIYEKLILENSSLFKT